MSQRLLRFGFHGFLNALPLLEPLQRRSRQAGFEMVVDVPSTIAEELAAGRLDLAMVPSIEYLKAGDHLRLLPGICIASRGAVRTVLLIAKTPLAEVKSLALDNRSRTSVALLRILHRFHPEVRFYPAAPDIAGMLKAHDAALIIGDPALCVTDCGKGTTIYDLSQEWFARTGKTFVHAVIAVRSGVSPTAETLDAIRVARQGLPDAIAKIAKTHAEKYGVPLETCDDYLRNKIRYDLGEEELQGLASFRDLCHEHGLIPQKHEIRFV